MAKTDMPKMFDLVALWRDALAQREDATHSTATDASHSGHRGRKLGRIAVCL